MTENDLELGEVDHTEDVDFPPSERTIHTQGYDLSLNTLDEQWADGTLIIPDFQREYVWDNAKASRLVESLLLNIPIPPLFLSETPDAKYEVVDGHQRVYSVIRYLDNQFALSSLRIQQELVGKRFHQLPDREQRYLRTRVIRAIIISADSAPVMKFEVFERLNTGGLALNSQEVRNAIYHGTFNDALRDLQHEPALRLCIGTKTPRRRMVDKELILRFLTLQSRLDSYKPPLLRFLNQYMSDHRNGSAFWIHEQKTKFVETISLVADVLGTSAFRVLDQDGHPIERNINRALFDAQMLAFSAADPNVARANRTEIIRQLGSLFQDEDFQDAIRRATGDRARTLERVGAVAGALAAAGVPLDSLALTKLSIQI